MHEHERDSVRGMSQRARHRVPARRAGGPGRPGAAPARMACAALLSCALAACGGGGNRGTFEDLGLLATEGFLATEDSPATEAVLTVTTGANGSVRALVYGYPVTVAAGASRDFIVTHQPEATLTAVAADGYRFAGWTLSAGLACGGPQARICELATGFIYAGASVSVAFRSLGLPPPDPAAWRGPGSVSVSASRNGAVQTAAPFAPDAFERWEGAPCDGSEELTCDVSSVTVSENLPIAVFRPFVGGGAKSLTFGLGYHGDSPDHFRVSFQDAIGAGFTPVPGLESLTPGPEPARLSVSVHLLPWGLGTYLTEVCDSNGCKEADGGRRTLEQPDSVAATGYFKAPNAETGDVFGFAIALSADGSTLAVGAHGDDSSATGVFAPTDAGYQAALDSRGTWGSGAVTVYRRSGAEWNLEAFVKAPKTGVGDAFGLALALSADGSALAVGASGDDSSATGALAPGDEGYQAALDDDSTYENTYSGQIGIDAGAVTVYRRSGSAWSIEAFVKAPKAGHHDAFGATLALDSSGTTLAVGARRENSSATGVFAPADDGYQAALDSGGRLSRQGTCDRRRTRPNSCSSGAVYIYRRSSSAWNVEAFIKAPNAGAGDEFGHALALSSTGSVLAVGAVWEDSSATGVFAPADDGYRTALDSSGTRSGAAYIYRHSGSKWSVEAFIKAPKADAGDEFGTTLALSADGSALAVGAPDDGSSATGVFAPADDGYRTAPGSSGLRGSGAVTVYRRSGSAWSIEAFIKAPNADAFDHFGNSLALSANGSRLAVGALSEDSSAVGVFVSTDTGYQAALDDDSTYESTYPDLGQQGINAGAVYIYRRSGSAWSVEAFVKAPKTGVGGSVSDFFSDSLALSADGSALAVGAFFDDGPALPQPVGGGSASSGNAVADSGAVYLY